MIGFHWIVSSPYCDYRPFIVHFNAHQSLVITKVDALTDGLVILRYVFGLRGDVLIAGVVAGDATRTTAEEIEAYLETLMPAI